MGKALIPIEMLQDGLNVIIGELNENYEFYKNQINFLNYFVNQWCTEKKSKQIPEIWNQHKATTQSNNCLEPNNYTMPSNLPRFHLSASQFNKDYI